MKLFIKRSVSPDKTCFTVFNNNGSEKYYACFKGNKPVSKIIVTDKNNNPVLKIRKIPVVGTHTFVFKSGKSHITFVTVLSTKGIFAYFYGNNWHINGNLAKGNFSIIDVDNSEIAQQIKHIDYVELDVLDASNELYCVAASICINLINTVDNLAIQTV